jgi:hypothetical protein
MVDESPPRVAAAIFLEMCGPMAGVTFVFGGWGWETQKISPVEAGDEHKGGELKNANA